MTRRGLFGALAAACAAVFVRPVQPMRDAGGFARYCADRIAQEPDKYHHFCRVREEGDGRISGCGSLIYAPAGVSIETKERERREAWERRHAAYNAKIAAGPAQ